MNISMVGIDVAKNVFQLHGISKSGRALLSKRLTRDKLLPFIAQMPRCLIVMEACGSANHWARQFQSYGHQVKLISPQYVKPFVKTNKNDRNDAQAICEAASRPSMNFVAPKSVEQQDIQFIHRIRERLILNRTALINQVRGLLAEYGIIINKGIWNVRKSIPCILEDAENGLTDNGRILVSNLYDELCQINNKIKEYDRKLQIIFDNNSMCQRLSKIEGLGIVSTTALIAAVGNVKSFKNGRQMSAWLVLDRLTLLLERSNPLRFDCLNSSIKSS